MVIHQESQQLDCVCHTCFHDYKHHLVLQIKKGVLLVLRYYIIDNYPYSDLDIMVLGNLVLQVCVMVCMGVYE